eukprot:CAMPEP_0175917260 /NCGR_PEP_ID=MMETSP0108-20121206/11269_1 /TAXON_ID=195067 ORGANISM="Goniomonas pacifica, Strain CCMP1869" /NCGR_SAMPLE_ID=MMETSP0108 /ASSEMBLY_ACC=CAM_ASM_000204 /LENGTH=258 /DNA_ID=CAMNT_0017239835 /DNA_START=12 /DNA_END=789 /DNA_ORIENTATION=-
MLSRPAVLATLLVTCCVGSLFISSAARTFELSSLNKAQASDLVSHLDTALAPKAKPPQPILKSKPVDNSQLLDQLDKAQSDMDNLIVPTIHTVGIRGLPSAISRAKAAARADRKKRAHDLPSPVSFGSGHDKWAVNVPGMSSIIKETRISAIHEPSVLKAMARKYKRGGRARSPRARGTKKKAACGTATKHRRVVLDWVQRELAPLRGEAPSKTKKRAQRELDERKSKAARRFKDTLAKAVKADVETDVKATLRKLTK